MSNAVGYLHRIAFLLLITQCSISARAQQNWFLFIQSESSQNFYVRIGETIYASSPVGHLIINGLHDSTYRLAIGFPQTQYREQQFFIPVSKKDHGFELKKSGTRSWVLYDWQTQETISSPRSDSLLYGEKKKDDGFASLMAAVVKDSAVLYTSIVKKEQPKVIPEVEKPDTAAIVKKETKIDSALTIAEKKMEDTATTAVAVKQEKKADTPAISKLNEQTGINEKKLVFLDNSIGIKKDTITVIIPLEKDTVYEQPKIIAKTETPKKEDTVKIKTDTAEKKAEPVLEKTNQPLMDSIATLKKADSPKVVKAEMKKIDSSVTAKILDTPRAEIKAPEPEKPSGLVMVNSDCSKFANDHDVDKLRVKMMNEKDAGNRIFIAHKVFKSMCFSTKQVKALSELFPGDELKFRFFETAWPFVSDTLQFKTLEETLTDSFFITRFRTLLKRQ